MCNTIDNLIIQIYQSRSSYIPPDYKVHVEYIIKNWIENDEKQGTILFPGCFCLKSDILCNVIWNDQMKQLIGDLNKIPFKQLSKIQTKYLKAKKEKHEIRMAKIQGRISNQKSTLPNEIMKLIQKRFKSWVNESEIFDIANLINNYFEVSSDKKMKFTGISHVRRLWIESSKFMSISSPHFSLTPAKFSVSDFKGEQYYIEEKEAGYDLRVEKEDKTVRFFKIMSTADSPDKTKIFPILKSSFQENLLKEKKGKNDFYVAIVCQVLNNNPEVIYCRFHQNSVRIPFN
jgi:hypothetical protein